ncbi:MAG: hypothetical protein Q9227_006920 [Pyrenula ochraceoflavens]
MAASLRSSRRAGRPATRSTSLDETDTVQSGKSPGRSTRAATLKASKKSFPTETSNHPPKHTSPNSDEGQSSNASSGNTEDKEDGSDDDEADSENDQPAAHAPSYRKRQGRKAGRPHTPKTENDRSSNGSIADLGLDLDVPSSDEDDDEIYQRVDDISDEDDDEAPAERIEESFLVDEFLREEEMRNLDGILGLEDFSASASEDGVDAAATTATFHDNDAISAYEANTTLTTLKAPSDDLSPISLSPSPFHPEGFLDDPDYDSDVTDIVDDSRPSTACPSALTLPLPTPQSTVPARTKKRTGPNGGPPIGIFKIDPTKPWSILDKTGTKMLFFPRRDTGSHDWLVKRKDSTRDVSKVSSTNSVSSSKPIAESSTLTHPSSQNSVDQTMVTGMVNPIMAGLSQEQQASAIHAEKPALPPTLAIPEHSPNFDIRDYDLSALDGGESFADQDEDSNAAEMLSESFDEFLEPSQFDAETPSTPMAPPSTPAMSHHSRSSSAFAHLNALESDLVMSFRRNNTFVSSPVGYYDTTSALTPGHDFMRDAYRVPKMPLSPRGHKRKASHEPYKSHHYSGVTPVERKILRPPGPLNKRRKTVT